MNKEYKKYIYLSLVISTIITVLGIGIYNHFFQRPMIVFENKSIARNVSGYESLNSQINFDDIIEKNRKAVVFIHAVIKDNDGGLKSETGSGFFVLPTGEIVTNAHVVENAEMILVTDDENHEYHAELVALNEDTDIAVIKIEGKNFPFIFFGNSDNLKPGDWILVIGSPYKLRNSVSAGIVSALNRDLGLRNNFGIENYIQTDAVANPGNSGGVM